MKKDLKKYLVSIFIFTLILFGIIWQHTELTILSSEEVRLREVLHSLKNKERLLRIEMNRLRSPGRIEGLAQGLGLVYPSPEEVILLYQPEIVAGDDQRESWWIVRLERLLSYFGNRANAQEQKEEG